MRNNSTTGKILSHVKKLPYFDIGNLGILQISPHYLRIALSRLNSKGEIIRLKKGLYTSRKFVERAKMQNNFSYFLEFLASQICSPSYLSLEYILYENNILTEIPQNFTLITKNKTSVTSNPLGIFLHHKIKDVLFCGFEVKKVGNLLIYRAEKSKALFDFLYLRKRMILNREMIKELRLNLDNFTNQDRKSLQKYIRLEGSKKMMEIYTFLFEKC